MRADNQGAIISDNVGFTRGLVTPVSLIWVVEPRCVTKSAEGTCRRAQKCTSVPREEAIFVPEAEDATQRSGRARSV